MREMRRRIRRAGLPTLLLLAACSSGGSEEWIELEPRPMQNGELITVAGTVRHVAVEGGVWIIESVDGERYQPIQMPESLQVDGLSVEAEGWEADDMVTVGMVGSVVHLSRIRMTDGAEPMPSPEGDDEAANLAGTSWTLEEIDGDSPAGVVTLEFTDDSSVQGNSACNTFRGPYQVSGDSIAFGPLATTRRACAQDLMSLETRVLEALSAVTGAERDGPTLRLFRPEGPELRFNRS